MSDNDNVTALRRLGYSTQPGEMDTIDDVLAGLGFIKSPTVVTASDDYDGSEQIGNMQ